jgi:hypothetical protein
MSGLSIAGSGLTLVDPTTSGQSAISSYQGYYGNFYSDTTQTDGGVTGTPMLFEHTVEAVGMVVVADGSSKYNRLKFLYAGTYNIQFSAQFHHTGGGGSGTTVNIWLRQNGTNVAFSDTKMDITTNSPYVVAAWNFVITVAANDYIELIWLTNNANIKIEADPAVAPAPAIPAVILTAQQIR